jgi:hypothetical protein
MSELVVNGQTDDLSDFAAEIADQVESFVIALREIARAGESGGSVALLLLEVSQLMLAGGRLGAIADVVPTEQFETDTGPDTDIDELRERLSDLLGPINHYIEIFDPYDTPPQTVTFVLSDDLADVTGDLLHGLAHYRAGRPIEALWWWQFSYVSHWGTHAGAALRALQSVVAHARLDSPEE